MNHIKEFQIPEILVKSLKQAWQQITKVFLESSPAQQEENHIGDLEAIKSWNESKDMSQCLHHLTCLHEAKHRVIRMTMSLQAWPDLYLSKTPLQSYLRSIMMEVKKCSEENKLEEITPIMKQLLRPAKLDLVKDLADIYHWLYNTEQVEAQGYTDYESLKAILHDILEEMEVVKVKSDLASAEQQDVGIKATIIVAQAVHFLFRNLRQAKYEKLFLTTLLFPFKCDANENNFLHLLSIQDLKYLYRMLDEQSEEICKMVPSSLPMQSYLFHLAVKIYNSEMVNLEITEIQIKGHLQYMQMEIQNELDPQVRQVLSQFYTDTDWKLLQSNLESLVGGFPVLQIQEDTSLRLIDLLSAVPVSEASKVTGTQKLLQASDNIQDLFRMLGLDKKYIQKFTLQDALIIRQEMQVNAKCTELEQLPLFILQKIMMHDYQSRTILFHPPNVQRKSDTDTDSDEDDSDTNSESDLVTSNEQPLTVHPMDSLLALFHCSDNFLRQDLTMRLSTCQIAIPLLLPDPFTQTLTLSLWAMRSIVKEWKCANPYVGEATSYECPIVDHPTPVVSFFRFSRSKLSKSKILNCVISNNLHYYFFNIDCEGGSTKPLLMDGLVELCWFLPAGKPNDPFPKVITFLNLRGDARQHPKQMKFLSRVSFMKFVLLSKTDLDETGIEVLQELAKPPGELVLMFSKGKKHALKLLQETLPRKQYKFSAMKISKQGLADIKKAIRSKINHNLSELCFNKKLSDYPEIAHMQDIEINVDEDDSECVQGRKLASEIQHKITESSFKGKSKDDILPLQGRKLWQEWARHDKEQHRHLERGSKGVEQHNSEKEDEKRRIRTTQLLRVERGKLVIHTFVLHLLNHTGDTQKYFLQWLKIFLDDISRERFFDLQSQYQAQKRQFHQQRKNGTGREDLEKPTIPTEIDDSIGLEHFLRELGQMYEAVVEQERVSPELRSIVNRLPRVAAKLLSSGYPLELLDGSASYVPLKWVCAVLGELRGLLGDSHLLVLSVLGAQSSGKSTLLNTMFGLQFMVSAGRCTRGAFIQLVPLGETMKTRVNCEYLLIIDTEGLHSPEQTSLETQKHNNELATFIIGQANVTLVNIFGEAPGEMENILQTAVHAFIRMKNVQLQPSCQFVHQNVATMMASDKGMAGREAFHKKLDYLTKIATVEEQCEDLYTVFNDVIEFDDDKDVWQFPNLWVGDPPMAPMNPGYSEKALALKSRLIDLIEMGGVQCTLSTFETRIINLWKAVLYENFVFSFKNALEITVYNSLDAKYAEWSWEFQLRMLEWEQQAENMIGSTDIQELDHLQITKELPSHVEKIYTDLSEKMGVFFEEHEQHDTLVQWKRQTELRLNDLRREQHTLVKSQCKMLITSRKALAKVEAIRERHVNELLYDVLELVPHQEEKLLSDSELEKKFDQKWIEWNEKFEYAQNYQLEGGCHDIEGSLEGCLGELLGPHGYKLIPKLLNESLKSRAHLTLDLKVIEETHISVKTRKMSLPLKTAQEATDIILHKSQCYLEKKQRQNFNQSFCHELLKDLLQAIADAQKEIPFTPEYKVDMALTVCGYALTKFEEMAEEFRKKNDPIEYLEREIRTPLLRIFISQYKQSSKEKTAAAVFCDLLAKPIENAVIGSLGHKIADNIRKSSCFSTKRALKGKVLCELAEKGSFEDYAVYLKNVRHSLQLWMKQYTEQYCGQDEGGKSKLVVFAEEELKLLVNRISDAARQVTNALTIDTEQDIEQWLNDFHCKLKKKLPLDLREIQKLVGAAKLTDFQFFTKEFCNGLARLHVTEFMISVDRWNKQPCDILSDALMGCCEQCPFCKEQCELTDPHHPGKHFIELHRPACLGGIKFSFSRELVLDVCSSLVGSAKLFVNPATKWKYHPYKGYQKIYPDWQIRPENSRYPSSYWKWFVAAYTSEIVEEFAAERTKVPKDWRNLTREVVVEDLKHIYN